MSIPLPQLLDALNSVIGIPLIPFDGPRIDYAGHAKNIDYLMRHNSLSGGRPRVVSIAGTSLVHHISYDDQVKLLDIAGERMAGEGVLMAAVAPNPLPSAAELIARQAALPRPPDVTLIMPLTGTYGPAGLHTRRCWNSPRSKRRGTGRASSTIIGGRATATWSSACCKSRRILSASRSAPLKTMCCPSLRRWTRARSSSGASAIAPPPPPRWAPRGHTSGINIVIARASDEINNAQRRRDYEAARLIEDDVSPLEDIRFMNERAYNYSAVMEAINCAGFADVVGGSGGPFNPSVPPAYRPRDRAHHGDAGALSFLVERQIAQTGIKEIHARDLPPSTQSFLE